jgi:hypothetical protein
MQVVKHVDKRMCLDITKETVKLVGLGKKKFSDLERNEKLSIVFVP